MWTEIDVELAQRHLCKGQAILVRQRAVVERLKAARQPADKAEALLSRFEALQQTFEICLNGLRDCRLSAERRRFIEWTFDMELEQVECLLGTFDRRLPDADIAEARKLIAVLSIVNNAPDMDAAFPRFLGHDMHWWADCSGLATGRTQWLSDLGIQAAVEAWVAAEQEWTWSRHAVDRRLGYWRQTRLP